MPARPLRGSVEREPQAAISRRMPQPSAPEARVTPDFVLRITAKKEDIDELNHVSNIVYVRWVQDVAVAHSNAAGWTREAYLKAGKIFIVRRHEIEYLLPALEGDEIDLVTWVESWSAATSVRRTRIVRVRDGKDLARASTLWALV